MKREEALKLLLKIEEFRQQPAMHKAEHDFTCRIIAAMVAEAGGCERTPAYRGGSFLLQREQHH